MEIVNYHLENYRDIAFAEFEYKLPILTLDAIQKLSTELGAYSYTGIKTTDSTFDNKTKILSNTKRNTTGFGNKRNKLNTEDEAWEKVKPFKTTQIEKKDGTEKLINDIRICLNKISNKNYESQRDVIIKYIREIIERHDEQIENSDELIKITRAIFEIASTNKFYSELYAILYKELIHECNTFQENIDPFIQLYLENIKTIQFIDPKVDYDKYCDNNKENDKRKAMSAYIVNLTKNEILNKSKMIDIILYLEELVLKYIDEENKTNEVEEITENLYIFTTMINKTMIDDAIWETIIGNIKNISQLKTKEHISLSNRALFKYMDILDYLKK